MVWLASAFKPTEVEVFLGTDSGLSSSVGWGASNSAFPPDALPAPLSRDGDNFLDRTVLFAPVNDELRNRLFSPANLPARLTSVPKAPTNDIRDHP
jgi:hypothetical protein